MKNPPGNENRLQAKPVDFGHAKRINAPAQSRAERKEITFWIQMKLNNAIKAHQSHAKNRKQKADVKEYRKMLFLEEKAAGKSP